MSSIPVRRRIVYPSNFWFLGRTALFHPTEGEGGEDSPAGTDNDLDKDDAGNAGDEGDEGDEQPKKKLVTLERHKSEVNKLKAKLKEYEDADSDRKKADMTEVEKLKSELKEAQDQLSKFQLGDRKNQALTAAKKALADDGLIIDPEKESTFMKAFGKLSFDEDSIDDDVLELATAFTTAKGKGFKTIAGKAGKSEKHENPLTYDGQKLKEIRNRSKEEYESVMAQRKELLAEQRRKASAS